MSSLRQHAKRLRLARLLWESPDRLDFLRELSAAELAILHGACRAALLAPHRALYQRLAHASKLLPTALTAHIAEHTLGPLLCARISAEMSMPRTLALCQHLSPPFMAAVTLHMDMDMDMDSLADLAAALPPESLRGIARELVARGEFITQGELVDFLPPGITTRIAAEIASGEVMLRILLFIKSPARLQSLLEQLPLSELGALARAAADDSLGLLPHTLCLLQRLTPIWQHRLIDTALAEGEATLTKLVLETDRLDLWGSALPFSALLDRAAQHRLLSLPIWKNEELLARALHNARNPASRPFLQALVAELAAEALERVMALMARQDTVAPPP